MEAKSSLGNGPIQVKLDQSSVNSNLQMKVDLGISKTNYNVYSGVLTSDVSGINMNLDKAQSFTGNIIIKDKANN